MFPLIHRMQDGILSKRIPSLSADKVFFAEGGHDVRAPAKLKLRSTMWRGLANSDICERTWRTIHRSISVHYLGDAGKINFA